MRCIPLVDYIPLMDYARAKRMDMHAQRSPWMHPLKAGVGTSYAHVAPLPPHALYILPWFPANAHTPAPPAHMQGEGVRTCKGRLYTQ